MPPIQIDPYAERNADMDNRRKTDFLQGVLVRTRLDWDTGDSREIRQ